MTLAKNTLVKWTAKNMFLN